MAKSPKKRETRKEVSRDTQVSFFKRILKNNYILNKLFNGQD